MFASEQASLLYFVLGLWNDVFVPGHVIHQAGDEWAVYGNSTSIRWVLLSLFLRRIFMAYFACCSFLGQSFHFQFIMIVLVHLRISDCSTCFGWSLLFFFWRYQGTSIYLYDKIWYFNLHNWMSPALGTALLFRMFIRRGCMQICSLILPPLSIVPLVHYGARLSQQ